MVYAEELGMTIKLLGTSRKLGEDTFTALVAPFLGWPRRAPLYSVNDVLMLFLYMETCLEMPCFTEVEQESFQQQVQ